METNHASEKQINTTELPIIYQDDYYIAVNKPPGLLVHRTNIDSRETTFALQTVRNMTGQHVYPIHRLDKPTSGVLLFALSSEIASQTKALFDANAVRKKYLAVVRGYINEQGTIDYPLRVIQDNYSKKKGKKEIRQDARTLYTRLATIELPYYVDKYPTSRYSLVELTLITGRRHQLRRHMKHISHPIIGDHKYGKTTHNTFFKDHYNCSNLMLTAVSLSFTHPVTHKDLIIQAAPNKDLQTIINTFTWPLTP